MGIMKLLRGPDINRGVKEFENAAGAVLLDVRSGPEYRGGHIPGSVNLPLQELNRIWEILDDEQTPLYVYCHSGSRSRQAEGLLRRMGFSNVKNLGGILAYSGKVDS